ncbi:sugar MFS transporter [Niabella sp. CC-SYL272]|uniref:sugar MFS transporter n=1 Tax=Niabella agricola TaxID=2891571 RepID=UPI001F1B4051|nr:sugar MFS transporter [Niabella agricola]MCF3108761.1 sugar MFS transporter [Niabella agricola]
MPRQTSTIASGEQQSIKKSLIIIGLLFSVFGFVTWLSSVLIPYLKLACELNNTQAYLVAFALYISYFVMALPGGWILKKTGFKKGISLGLIIMAVGSLIFIPAALSRTYPVFLTGLFVQGAGLSILQTASNPYVTILGPRKTAARRISIMGICNGIAGIIAPIVLGSVILNDTDAISKNIAQLNPAAKIAELNALAHRVILPYIIMAIVLVILALLVHYSGLPEVEEEEDAAASTAANNKKSILQFPHLLIGAFTLFLYVGAEVISGNTIIDYGSYQGIPMVTAKFFTSMTLTAMLIGYLIGIISMPRFLSQEKALQYSALAGIVFLLCALFTTGYLSVLFIALLGLANALMWPAIWPLAIANLGRFTKIGSSLLIMSICGGALLPLVYGHFADISNPQKAYWIVAPCYLMILYYSLRGYKIRTQ